jgi:uncharacterized membrane protein
MLDPPTLGAIVAMALVTYATRIGGLFLAGRLELSDRAQSAFDAIPAAVLTAIIAPAVLATGLAETLAALATVIAATRLPLIGTIAVGVAAIVLLRGVLG